MLKLYGLKQEVSSHRLCGSGIQVGSRSIIRLQASYQLGLRVYLIDLVVGSGIAFKFNHKVVGRP